MRPSPFAALLLGVTSCVTQEHDPGDDIRIPRTSLSSASGGASGVTDAGDAGTQDASMGSQDVTPTPCPSATECGGALSCCTRTGACGIVVPEHVFSEGCHARGLEPGELDDACPDSPTYCTRGSCDRYYGCRREMDGACGYWVDVVRQADESAIYSWNVDLGCVEQEELEAP